MGNDESERDHTNGGAGDEITHRTILRNLEHNPLSTKTLLAVVLALPVAGIFIGGFVSARAALSTIDARIVEVSPTILKPIDDKLASINASLAVILEKQANQDREIQRLRDK